MKQKILSLLSNLLFISCLSYFINGLFPQFFLALKGSLSFDVNMILKMLIVPVAAFGFVLMGKLKKKYINTTILSLLFMFYLVLNSLFFYYALQKNIVDLFSDYNAYYFFLILLPLILFLNESLSEKLIVRWFLVLFIPCVVIGFIQFFGQTPFLPTYEPNEYFQVYSWDYYGKVRAFSLFDSGISFGHFIAIVSSIALAFFLYRRKSKWLFLVCLCLLAGYITLTRNAYLEILVTLISTFIIAKAKKNTWLLKVLPFVYGLIGVIISLVAPVISRVYRSDLFGSDSIFMRFDTWERVFKQWTGGSGVNTLFGLGVTQGVNNMIDNSFLAVAFHIGLIGFVLWFFLMNNMWLMILNKCLNDKSVLNVALTSFFATWMLTGLFNTNFMVYIIAFYVFLISKKNIKLEKSEKKRIFKMKRIVW
ncbi:O-antigen ligase family protein [Priestia flexa]|uniref:O-antigen ligase family protein n=1 Tax=Priestia flexa TaxID=86664 RepID=UPI003D024A96